RLARLPVRTGREGMAQAPMTQPGDSHRVEWGEVQRLLLSGFPKHVYAHFLLLRMAERAGACRFLTKLLDDGTIKFGWGERTDRQPAANVAFTREGLEALGVDDGTLHGFSPEFLEGMTTEARSRKMADTGDSAPSEWLWGYDKRQIHLVLAVYAASEAD